MQNNFSVELRFCPYSKMQKIHDNLDCQFNAFCHQEAIISLVCNVCKCDFCYSFLGLRFDDNFTIVKPTREERVNWVDQMPCQKDCYFIIRVRLLAGFSRSNQPAFDF